MPNISSSYDATTVVKTETTTFSEPRGLYWHQIDAGVSTTGSLAINADFGSGLREIGTIDFTDTSRLPLLIFGCIKELTAVPTGLDVDYKITYIATGV